jgi:hypothetical protein
MDSIFISTLDRSGSPSSGCKFEFSTDGGTTFSPTTQSNGLDVVSVPSIAKIGTVTIRATPNDAKFWSATGTFKLDASGAVVADKAPRELFFVLGTFKVKTDTLTLVYFHLQIFRDATDELFKKLLQVPSDRDTSKDTTWPPTSWNSPGLTAPHPAVIPAVLSGSDVTFATRSYSPSAEVRILERKGSGVVPKLFVVAWPPALPRTADAGATPFLVFFTHLLNQNLAKRAYLRQYPDGWDYLYYSIYRYLNYSADPLNLDGGGTFTRGLLYQIDASGKRPALVIPVGDANKPDNEVGDCVNAASLEEFLLEIQSFFHKLAGAYRPPVPTLGRVALASFSSGNNGVQAFLAAKSNASHAFFLDTLREVYCLDTPRSFAPLWAMHALAWAGVGAKKDEKMIRIYGTHEPTFKTVHTTLLTDPAPGAAPYVSTTAKLPNRTVSCLPEASWAAAVTPRPADTTSSDFTQAVHQLFCGTLLDDALRRSGF